MVEKKIFHQISGMTIDIPNPTIKANLLKAPPGLLTDDGSETFRCLIDRLAGVKVWLREVITLEDPGPFFSQM